jgi:hypothetical protein
MKASWSRKDIEIELRIKSQRYHQTAEIRNKNYPQDATGIMCEVRNDDQNQTSSNHGNNFIFNYLKKANQVAEVNQ